MKQVKLLILTLICSFAMIGCDGSEGYYFKPISISYNGQSVSGGSITIDVGATDNNSQGDIISVSPITIKHDGSTGIPDLSVTLNNFSNTLADNEFILLVDGSIYTGNTYTLTSGTTATFEVQYQVGAGTFSKTNPTISLSSYGTGASDTTITFKGYDNANIGTTTYIGSDNKTATTDTTIELVGTGTQSSTVVSDSIIITNKDLRNSVSVALTDFVSVGADNQFTITADGTIVTDNTYVIQAGATVAFVARYQVGAGTISNITPTISLSSVASDVNDTTIKFIGFDTQAKYESGFEIDTSATGNTKYNVWSEAGLKQFTQDYNAMSDSTPMDITLLGDIEFTEKQLPLFDDNRYSGVFDGNGYALKGLEMDYKREDGYSGIYHGLINLAIDSTIKNVTIIDPIITIDNDSDIRSNSIDIADGGGRIAILVAQAHNSSMINNKVIGGKVNIVKPFDNGISFAAIVNAISPYGQADSEIYIQGNSVTGLEVKIADTSDDENSYTIGVGMVTGQVRLDLNDTNAQVIIEDNYVGDNVSVIAQAHSVTIGGISESVMVTSDAVKGVIIRNNYVGNNVNLSTKYKKERYIPDGIELDNITKDTQNTDAIRKYNNHQHAIGGIARVFDSDKTGIDDSGNRNGNGMISAYNNKVSNNVSLTIDSYIDSDAGKSSMGGIVAIAENANVYNNIVSDSVSIRFSNESLVLPTDNATPLNAIISSGGIIGRYEVSDSNYVSGNYVGRNVSITSDNTYYGVLKSEINNSGLGEDMANRYMYNSIAGGIIGYANFSIREDTEQFVSGIPDMQLLVAGNHIDSGVKIFSKHDYRGQAELDFITNDNASLGAYSGGVVGASYDIVMTNSAPKAYKGVLQIVGNAVSNSVSITGEGASLDRVSVGGIFAGQGKSVIIDRPWDTSGLFISGNYVATGTNSILGSYLPFTEVADSSGDMATIINCDIDNYYLNDGTIGNTPTNGVITDTGNTKYGTALYGGVSELNSYVNNLNNAIDSYNAKVDSFHKVGYKFVTSSDTTSLPTLAASE